MTEQDGRQSMIKPLALFEEFYELFRNDVLSPTCVYALLNEAPTLVTLEQEAQQSEITRILRRQLTGRKSLSRQRIGTLAQQLSELAKAMDRDERHTHTTAFFSAELQTEGMRYGLIEVTGWLLVMIFLARKELD